MFRDQKRRAPSVGPQAGPDQNRPMASPSGGGLSPLFFLSPLSISLFLSLYLFTEGAGVQDQSPPRSVMSFTVVLNGPAPWGFRLVGGKDFNQPLTISRVTPGGKAALADVRPGDLVVAIQGAPSEGMMHCHAQNHIKEAGQQLTLALRRTEVQLWSPRVTVDGKLSPFKINLESTPQEVSAVGVAHNRRAQPFVAAANLDDARQVVSAVYNTPIGLYSSGNIRDAMEGQMKGLVAPQHDSPRTLANIEDSDVYRLLQKDGEDLSPSQPRQSGSFRALQDFVDSDGNKPMPTRTVKAPTTKVGAPAGNLQKLPICDKCGNGVVGTVVKARDKLRHPTCFVCADCDVNLKQKGYFLVAGDLYCEVHARVRTAPPESFDL
ncbi:PDZ and LIM domain protein 3-like [Stigmatopora argus]